MVNFSVAFGQHLLRQRLRGGLSQSELAVQIGVDPSVISRLESGTTRCSVEMFTKLSSALGAEPSDSLDEFMSSLSNVDYESRKGHKCKISPSRMP